MAGRFSITAAKISKDRSTPPAGSSGDSQRDASLTLTVTHKFPDEGLNLVPRTGNGQSFRRIMELRAERRRLWPTKSKKW